MWAWIGKIIRAVISGIVDSLLQHNRKIKQKGKDDVTDTMLDDHIMQSSGCGVRRSDDPPS